MTLIKVNLTFPHTLIFPLGKAKSTFGVIIILGAYILKLNTNFLDLVNPEALNPKLSVRIYILSSGLIVEPIPSLITNY